jgi:hypothetical protein
MLLRPVKGTHKYMCVNRDKNAAKNISFGIDRRFGIPDRFVSWVMAVNESRKLRGKRGEVVILNNIQWQKTKQKFF